MEANEYDTWKLEPTPENMSNVLQSLEPTINSEVQRYNGPKPILRGRANVLAIKAIKSYDPTRGTKLRSWVVTQLQPLTRYSRKMQPIRSSELATRQSAEIHRVSEEMTDQLGRAPSVAELADEIGLSQKRITKIRQQVQPALTESMFEGPDMSQPGVFTPSKVDESEEIVYESLSTRDKAIYDMKTGKHGKTQISNMAIAKRMGVTPALISQRSSQIAQQIQDLATRG